MKDLADNNFKFDGNGRKFTKWVENIVAKGEIAHNKRTNQGLFGKGLIKLADTGLLRSNKKCLSDRKCISV